MLTERVVRDAKPEDGKTRIIWDNRVKGLSGFGLRVTATGVKSYILNYRINGHERRATIGRASEFSLKEAREIAATWLADVKTGEADPLEVKREAKEAPTVNDGLDYFFNDFAPARIKEGLLKESTFRDYKQQANKYLRPSPFGRLRISDVQRSDVEKTLPSLTIDPKTGKTKNAIIRNRVLSLTSSLFSLFEEKEWRPQNSNPCRGIKRAKEEARDRVLDSSELAALAKALKKFEGQYPVSVAAIRTLMLTGLRVSESLGIEWSHIDLKSGRLVLPDTKTGRRVHVLPKPALSILEGLPRHRCNFVFTNDGKTATVYRTVRKHFIQIVAEAGIEGATLHDLRRTYVTTAAAAGVGSYALRDLLGHASSRIADRYVRAVGEAVGEARAETTDKIAAMMDGEGG